MGPELPCPCGGSAQYHGRREKTLKSSLGPLHHGGHYHCEQCESGFCPRDWALGLESFSLTPGALRMTASAGALVSFEESSWLLQELAGVEVSAKQVERAAEALGAEIAVDEHQQGEQPEGSGSHHVPGNGWNRDADARPRSQDRAGKQADVPTKTREAKIVTIGTAESRDEEGKPVRDPGSITYSAAIERAAILERQALQNPTNGSASPNLPQRDFMRCFEIVAIPYVQASWFARHPGLPYRCALKAAGQPVTFPREQITLRYRCMHRVCSPSESGN